MGYQGKTMTPVSFRNSITITLPMWMNGFIESWQDGFETVEKRMRFVIACASKSISSNSGGPFAAAVFDHISHALVAAGVNLVTTQCCSSAHAEIVALSFAQQNLGRFDLSDGGKCQYELVTSTAPCAMCLGAVPWSGVTRLACGARDEDARAVGFDEGAKVADWIAQLNNRGIEVLTDVCREEAASVLRSYASLGGIIYNSKNSF
jgi:tRNA(Arg) A34 adenosine deaminase TadA